MLIGIIVACEILFWVVLLAGLTARYLLRRPRLGAALLVAAPLVDLVLLTASVLDLRSGAVAGTPHVLSAVYLGVSAGFGHRMIRWADQRFAHRFAGGPPPERAPRSGPARAAYLRRDWLRHLVAWTVGCGLGLAAILLVSDAHRTEAFTGLLRLWSIALAIDFAYSFSHSLDPRASATTD